MQTCPKCKQHKPLDRFPPSRRGKGDRWCNACLAQNAEAWRRRQPDYRALRYAWRRREPEVYLLRNARARAKVLSLEFQLTHEDVFVTTDCPMCLRPMSLGHGRLHDLSPTVDRIDPLKGYVPDNVWVICHQCNRKKDDLTVEQLRDMADIIEGELLCRGQYT